MTPASDYRDRKQIQTNSGNNANIKDGKHDSSTLSAKNTSLAHSNNNSLISATSAASKEHTPSLIDTPSMTNNSANTSLISETLKSVQQDSPSVSVSKQNSTVNTSSNSTVQSTTINTSHDTSKQGTSTHTVDTISNDTTTNTSAQETPSTNVSNSFKSDTNMSMPTNRSLALSSVKRPSSVTTDRIPGSGSAGRRVSFGQDVQLPGGMETLSPINRRTSGDLGDIDIVGNSGDGMEAHYDELEYPSDDEESSRDTAKEISNSSSTPQVYPPTPRYSSGSQKRKSSGSSVSLVDASQDTTMEISLGSTPGSNDFTRGRITIDESFNMTSNDEGDGEFSFKFIPFDAFFLCL